MTRSGPQCVVEGLRTGMGLMGEHPDKQADDYALAVALEIVEFVDQHECPCCLEPLERNSRFADSWINAGSRMTHCRCIPICPTCGTHESLEGIYSQWLVGFCEWPLNSIHVQDDVQEWTADAVPITGFLADGNFLTRDGVSALQHREHPGGWLEHGHDDRADAAEWEGRAT